MHDHKRMGSAPQHNQDSPGGPAVDSTASTPIVSCCHAHNYTKSLRPSTCKMRPERANPTTAFTPVRRRETDCVLDFSTPHFLHLDQRRCDRQPRSITAGPAQRPLGQLRGAEVEDGAVGTDPARERVVHERRLAEPCLVQQAGGVFDGQNVPVALATGVQMRRGG